MATSATNIRRRASNASAAWSIDDDDTGAPLASKKERAPHPTRLLVAEDDADMSASLERLLGPLGTVEVVHDGNEALAAIRRRMPDVVLSDVWMPNLDGFGLVEALRNDPRTRALPIVLVSARTGEDSRIEGATVGADDYIVKPFSPNELIARVRSQLELARLRREHAEALRASDQRFRALVTASSDAVYQMSADWSELRRLVGRHFIADTTGPNRTWLQRYIPPDDQPRVLAAIRKAIERKTAFELEHRVVCVDGSLGWTFSRAIPLFDEEGEITEWFGAASDITKRKRSEEALRQSEERYRALVEQSVDGIFVSDAGGRDIVANGSGAAMLGYSSDELRALAVTDVVAREDIPGVDGDLAELAAGRVLRTERRFLRKDGSTFPGEVVARRMPDGRLLAILRDITERKRGERAAALDEANAKLLQVDAQRNEFIAMLSHELRNPLSPILNGLEILKRAAPGGDQAQFAMTIMHRQVDHLRRIIDDLLDVTRIARGKIALDTELVDLNVAAERIVEDHRPEFAVAGVELGFAGASHPVWAKVDPTRMAQVLGNLLKNSSKFTPRGGRTELSISTSGSGATARAVVHVTDTGRGIPPELVGRLFNPFSQADTSLDRQKGGLGLGLAVAKGLVELHGGTIHAESAGTDRGTTMVVTLPLAELESPPSAERDRATFASHRRVLVIEDNEDARESLRQLLELAGHEVEVAGDGNAGLTKAREFRPDIVLCDIGLPGIDGYEVARRIREDHDLRSMKLVAVSGYARPEDVASGKEAGFDAHLAKPPTLAALTALLETQPPAR